MSASSYSRTGTASPASDLPAGRTNSDRDNPHFGTSGEEPRTIEVTRWLKGDSAPTELPTEHLASAQHVGKTKVLLRFSDGHRATVDLAKLDIDTSLLKLDTMRASSWGSAAEVEDANGHTIHLDSAVLRSHCDSRYAAELRKAIAELTTQ